MPEPIELSDELIAEARAVSKGDELTATRQIEHWARLGRILEPYLHPAMVNGEEATALSHLLSTINAPEGRQRLKDYLAKRPYPHFEPVPGSRKLLVKIDEDGTRTTVQFLNGQFVPAESPST